MAQLTLTADGTTLDLFVAAGSGEANTGANVGGGDADVFKDKTGVTLNFRTVSGTGGVVVTENGDVVEIDGSGISGTGETNTAANVGVGSGVFRDKIGVNLNFRSLAALGNITVAVNGDVVEIGGGGETNLGATLGGGSANVFKDKTGVTLNFRTVTGTGGIVVSENGDVVEVDGSGISATGTATFLAFFDASTANGSLVGEGPGNSGKGRLKAVRNMIVAAVDAVGGGACAPLLQALRRTDGTQPPPDFVSGGASACPIRR